MDIVDVVVRSKATSGSGSLKLTNGTNDISNAIACATDKAVARAGTVDSAYSTIAKGGTLKVVSNGSTDRGLITIIAIKRD
jgi:hypothetical protein